MVATDDNRGIEAELTGKSPSVHTLKSNIPIRADQGNTTESEKFCGVPCVLSDKVKLFVDIVRQIKLYVVCSGIVTSNSSGLQDNTSKSSIMVPRLRLYLDARPIVAHWHRAVAAMECRGNVHCYVQQNQDDLPYKASFPQEKMNKIHSKWFDLSNPVV